MTSNNLNFSKSGHHKIVTMNLQFSNLTVSVPSGNKKELKTILKGVSGNFVSGQLTGIVGSSGAGKSTLLNILSGYSSNMVSGKIQVNMETRDPKSFRKKSCYIMQEDHLLPSLSVKELMECAATLKLGRNPKNKNTIISEILDSLSLSCCQSTRVNKLSGGEKKRLSIALELISNPPVMFFDEPTSGLDSRSSFLCICLLKKLAEEGRNIICTIHQPSSRILSMFDHLYALAEGQCIYRGTVEDLIPYLSTFNLDCPSYYNPADFLLEAASGDYGADLSWLVDAVQDRTEESTSNIIVVESEENSPLTHENNIKATYNGVKEDTKLAITTDPEAFITEYSTSFWVQFSVLFKRTFLSIIRDTLLTKLRLATHVFVGLIIGMIYFNVGNEAKRVISNIGNIFFSVVFHVFISMMPTVTTFPAELKVFIKEHLNHWYSLKAYYFAKTLADIPFQVAFTIIYTVLMYFMTGQPYEVDRFCYFLLLAILISLVAQTIGLAVGALFSVEQALFFATSLIVPAMLFCGNFVSFSTIPVYLRWLTYVTYCRYGYEGSILAIYGMNREKLDCSEAFCIFKYPRKILELVEMDDSFLWFDVIMLIIYFIVMRVVVYLLLKWKLNKEK